MTDNQKIKTTRTVAEKIESAKKGHLGDQFEVATWLREGRYSLDENMPKSTEYLGNITETLPLKRPYFTSLNLVNFKGIRSIRKKISLDPRLNVFVGVNGSGKTTVIESIVRVSSWIVNGIKNKANGRGIEPFEINNRPEAKDCAIMATIALDDESLFNITLYKNKKNSAKGRSALAEFKNLSEMYYFLNTEGNGQVSLPLFAHYSVSRALEIKKEDGKKDDELTVFNNLDGYNQSFEEARNFKQLLRWMMFCGAQNESGNDAAISEYTQLQVKYDTTLNIFGLLPDEVKENSELGRNLLKDLEKIRIKLSEIQTRSSNTDIDIIKVVKHAIYRFMNIKNIRMEVGKDNISVLLDKNDVTISVTDLSQGEKALFSLNNCAK